jgi:ribosomal-protein-alanine N-acetyltransferase
MVSDPEVTRFLPSAPAPTMDTFARAIEARHAMELEIGCAMWAVDDARTGTFIGHGIRPAKSMDQDAGSEIDLAQHFTRSSWHKGYATEAAVAVLAHGLGPTGLESIIMGVVAPENVGSRRVMEKAGMRNEGLADFYGMKGLKKYVAGREWWSPPFVG